MKEIFMVRLDWSTTDADGIDTELYEDYDQAYDRYKEIITEQLKNFWQGEVTFDTDGDPGEEYEFSDDDNNSNESDVFWHLSLKDDYYVHTFVDLLRMPLYTKHEDNPVFTVRYGDKEYTFTEGAKALIFHAGIDSGAVKQKDLPDFTEKVYACYITDSNDTNLLKLADYVAENWKSLRKADRYAILDKYYSEAEL